MNTKSFLILVLLASFQLATSQTSTFYSLSTKALGLCPGAVNYILTPRSFSGGVIEPKGIPIDKEFRIVRFDFQKEQTLYEKRLAGLQLTQEEASYLEETGTSGLSTTPTNHSLCFLVYFEKDKKVLIPDINSDFDFGNDKKFSFNLAEFSGKNRSTMPNEIIQFEYEYAENGMVSKQKATLMLEPIHKTFTYKDSDGKYHINLNVFEYAKGEITANNRKYYYAAQPGGNAKTTFKRFQMHISESPFATPQLFGSEDIIDGRDSLSIDGMSYTPRFSTFGDTLFMEPTVASSQEMRQLFGALSQCTPINTGKLSIEELRKSNFTIVDFWGTWCVPCVKDMPKLKKLHEDFKSHLVNVIGIAVDADEQKVKQFLDKRKIEHPVIFENLKYGTEWIYKKLNIEVFPTYLILDKEGRIVFSTSSIQELQEKLKSVIQL